MITLNGASKYALKNYLPKDRDKMVLLSIHGRTMETMMLLTV